MPPSLIFLFIFNLGIHLSYVVIGEVIEGSLSCPAHNCSFGRTWETYRQPYYFLHADRPYLYFSWLVAHDPFECMQFAHDLARLSRDLVSRPFIFNDYDYYYHVLMAYISHQNL